MNDSKVYVIGSHNYTGLGIGDAKFCQELTQIHHLSGKGIEQFFDGFDCMFARTINNHIYTWGCNHSGQLGRGFKIGGYERYVPEKHQVLSDTNILQIICDWKHCLALSSKGKIYGWGCNAEGQVGCGKRARRNYVLVPKIIVFEVAIKYIETSGYVSTAIDINGNAFYWGNTSKGIQWKTKKMFVEGVNKIKVSWASKDQGVILNESGKVFVYSFTADKIIFEIIVGLKVVDIIYFLCQTQESVHRLIHKKGVSEKLNFINFYEYYSSEENTTYKTIDVMTEQSYGQKVKYLTTKEIQLNPEYNRQTNEELLILKDKNVFNKKHENSFAMIKILGQGSFGEVGMVKEKLTDDFFAIKKIEIKGYFDIFLIE